jgi:hypothetical protein
LIIKSLSVLLLILVVFPGCGRFGKPAPAAVARKRSVVLALDSSCKVKLPANWVELSITGKSEVLRVGLPSEDAAFNVIRLPKEESAKGDTYRSLGSHSIEQLTTSDLFDQMKVTRGPDDVLIDGRHAVRYEVEGVVKKSRARVIYFISVVEGQKSFFRLVGILFPPEGENSRTPLEEVTNSFVDRE